MRFSIITVTLNGEKYLAETLASTASQTFKDFEHLIWDGGSQDATLSTARSFPHVSVFEGKDKGLSDAMNQAARLARGEFLLYLHADDLLAHDQVLRDVDGAIRTHRCPWLYGMVKSIDAQGKELGSCSFVPYEKKRLEKYNIISHPACFLSRSLFFERGGFDLSLRYCMDYDLWLRCSSIISPYALAAPLACFRSHPGSLSTSLPLAVADEAYAVRKKYLRGPLAEWRSWRTWKRRRREIL